MVPMMPIRGPGEKGRLVRQISEIDADQNSDEDQRPEQRRKTGACNELEGDGSDTIQSEANQGRAQRARSICARSR